MRDRPRVAAVEVRGGPSRGTYAFFDDWQTVEVSAARDGFGDAYGRAAKRFPGSLGYETRGRERNPQPHHHIPPRTVKLGTVLDLQTELHPTRTDWDVEINGWLMLTDADAMTRRPGDACLYLVRGQLRPGSEAPSTASGEDTYKRWHKRDHNDVNWLEGLPDLIGSYVGLALRIGYRSDKWSKPGELVDYDHDFCERGHTPPEVWADVPELERASAIVIVGGDMRVTPEGID